MIKEMIGHERVLCVTQIFCFFFFHPGTDICVKKNNRLNRFNRNWW